MENENPVEIICIIDKSGSMELKKTDAIRRLMNKAKLILIIININLLLFGCGSSYSVRYGEPKVVWKDFSKPLASIRYALVCGVAEFSDAEKLLYVNNNLDLIAQTLRENAGFTHILFLRGNEVTKNTIKKNIENISKLIGGVDNVFLFYYAGHGIAGSSGKRMLFMSDTNPDDESTMISEDDISKWIGDLKRKAEQNNSKEVVTIAMFDACYPASQSAGAFAPPELKVADITLYSCKLNEKSYQRMCGDVEKKTSLFTGFFCDELKSADTSTDFMKIFNNVKHSVTKANSNQHPIINSASGIKEFKITTEKKTAPVIIEIRSAETDKIVYGVHLEILGKKYKTGETCNLPLNSEIPAKISSNSYGKDRYINFTITTPEYFDTHQKITILVSKTFLDTPSIEELIKKSDEEREKLIKKFDEEREKFDEEREKFDEEKEKSEDEREKHEEERKELIKKFDEEREKLFKEREKFWNQVNDEKPSEYKERTIDDMYKDAKKGLGPNPPGFTPGPYHKAGSSK